MIKANQFQELIKQEQNNQLEKQKRIQEDTRTVEQALEDLYIKVQNSISKGTAKPKYAEISTMLEKEVQDNLVVEQNYFIDIVGIGRTRIYYNKEDFENRNKIQFNTPFKKEESFTDYIENKYGRNLKQKSEVHNEENFKNTQEDELIEKNITFKGMPVTIIGDKNTMDFVDKLNKVCSKLEKGWR